MPRRRRYRGDDRYHDLALSAGRHELDAATRLDDSVAGGLARFGWVWKWVNVGARPQADAANRLALAELEAVADPSAADSGAAEMLGMHHLLAAKLAARASPTRPPRCGCATTRSPGN